MKPVVCFGEVLMRLDASRNHRLGQTDLFNSSFGGSELNVAIALSQLGIPVKMVTALPDNPLGHKAIHLMRQYQINIDHVQLLPGRMGLYFSENGTATRSGKVVYDRAGSSFCQLTKQSVDWQSVFENASWFHTSGITPALTQQTASICQYAIEQAHQASITMSIDLNYRSKLWQYGKSPNEVMPSMVKYAHVLLGDFKNASHMLGLPLDDLDIPNTDESTLREYYNIIAESYSNIHTFAMTLRSIIHASHHQIGGLAIDERQITMEPMETIYPIVDRVGSGDAFMAGLIYGILKQFSQSDTIKTAVHCCKLKHSIIGDYLQFDKNEVEDILKPQAKKMDR